MKKTASIALIISVLLLGVNVCVFGEETEDSLDLSQYQAGTKVYHKKFGEGIINYVEPEGDDLKVDIQFEKFGHKRLMAKYANLEII